MNKILKQISQLSSQSIVDAMSILDWPQTMIHGSRPLFPGRKICGLAVTLRFVLFRKDLFQDLPKGSDSAEYRAFELCDPEKVLVVSSVGPWESIGGDIKFLRLYHRPFSPKKYPWSDHTTISVSSISLFASKASMMRPIWASTNEMQAK